MKLLFGLVVSSLFLSACSDDKANHLLVGSAISSAVVSTTESQLLGCAASLSAGVLKEAIDVAGYGVADAEDIFATAAGCSLSYQF